ncbi:MAG: hypothetical protein IJ371_05945 [Clostridia bacterium]|nr:hypothetical protein [Clostridia bacterium]
MGKSKFKYTTGKIVINDFSKTNLNTNQTKSNAEGITIYNFKNSNGVLEKGMGIQDFTVYHSNDLDSLSYKLDCSSLNLEYFNKVLYFKQYFPNTNNTTHRLLIHGSDSKLYMFQMYSSIASPTWIYSLQFEDIPAVLEYKKDGLDSILISANDKLVVWSTGRTPYELSNVPTITSMCVYNDELFCTIAGETDKIWYTSNLNPETIGEETEETKYIIMEGSAGGGRKIVILKENMYVFCDYGIGKINTYAKEKPTYHQIYTTNGQICPNTVVQCGDFVIFLTHEGLYKFNGTSVTKLEALQNLLEACSGDYAIATSLRDDYYLALNIDFKDNRLIGCEYSNSEMKNNALIKLNLHNYSFEILRGVDIKDMLALNAGIDEKVILTFNTKYHARIGEITDTGRVFSESQSDKGFLTNYIVPNNFEDITIRKIVIDCSLGMGIRITTDRGKFYFSIPKTGINVIYTTIQCKRFQIAVLGTDVNNYTNFVEIEYVKKS